MIKISKKEATVESILRKSHANSNGEHPVKIRVTFARKAKFYPIKMDGKAMYISEIKWNELHEQKISKSHKELKSAIDKLKTGASIAVEKVTRDGKAFTWERFEKEFLYQDSQKGFLEIFNDHLKVLLKENRIGTYKSYNNAYQAFKAFQNEKELSPADITTELLKTFETFLIKRGCGKTTVGIYARVLKIIFNLAADKTPSLLENYPFARKQTDRNRYKIKTGAGHKGDSLSIEQLQKFISIKTDKESLVHEDKLYWLFSFYCQGMNIKDVSLLKNENITEYTIRYVRAKTRDTETKETIMEIPLTETMIQIIKEIGNTDKQPSSFVFRIIPEGLASTVKRRTEREKSNEERIDEIIRQKIKMINSRLKAICKANDLPEITTYWARHTYANLVRKSGESTDMIKELLGHSDVRTTEAYLKRFDNESKRKVNEKVESLLKGSK